MTRSARVQRPSDRFTASGKAGISTSAEKCLRVPGMSGACRLPGPGWSEVPWNFSGNEAGNKVFNMFECVLERIGGEYFLRREVQITNGCCRVSE